MTGIITESGIDNTAYVLANALRANGIEVESVTDLAFELEALVKRCGGTVSDIEAE